jgi:SAM-dependent methyltransferase
MPEGDFRGGRDLGAAADGGREEAMAGYDETYAAAAAVFGAEPDGLLAHHLGLLVRDLPVLDVGAGQGRNALFLARRGFAVDALEPSAVGAAQIAARAVADGLPVRVISGGFEDVPVEANYGTVLVMGLVPDLPEDQIPVLLERARGWLVPNGLLFVTGFTTEDPSFETWRRRRQVAATSFADEAGRVRTFLAPGAILTLATGFEPVVHQDALGPWHRHGDSPPERHARFEAVLRRTSADLAERSGTPQHSRT